MSTRNPVLATWFYSFDSPVSPKKLLECFVSNPQNDSATVLAQDARRVIRVDLSDGHVSQKSQIDELMRQRQQHVIQLSTQSSSLEHIQWRVQYLHNSYFTYLEDLVTTRSSVLSKDHYKMLLREFAEITCQPETCAGVLVCSPQYDSEVTVQAGFFCAPDSLGRPSGPRTIVIAKLSETFKEVASSFLENYFEKFEEGDQPITLHDLQTSMHTIFLHCRKQESNTSVGYVDVSKGTFDSMSKLLGGTRCFQYACAPAPQRGKIRFDTVMGAYSVSEKDDVDWRDEVHHEGAMEARDGVETDVSQGGIST